MTVLVIQYDTDSGVIEEYGYRADHEYTPDDDEIVLDSADVDHRDLGLYEVDTNTETLVKVRDHPEETAPDPLDRAAIPASLKQDYRDAKDVYQTERQNFIDAKQAGDTQGQLDAIAALLESGVVPALDTLFKTVMDEEP